MKSRAPARIAGSTTAFIALLALAACGSGGSLDPAASTPAAGPQLSVASADVDAAMRCTAATGTPVQAAPVLLIHGTGLTADESWAGNYAKTLPALGYNTCEIDLPNRSLGDIQISAEYIVAAVRRMAATYKHRVDLVTHSQGGLEARWALKFWPDIAARVDDLVTLAAPNHGTPTADLICVQSQRACTASVQQQRPGSNFLAALNRDESVPAGVSYTSIYSLTDEIVTTLPPNYSPAVSGATNVLLQDICPLRPVTHLEELTDAVVYALVLDAFTNDGAANPARIPATVCAQLGAPGVAPNDFLATNSTSYLAALQAVGTGPASTEPPLAPYASRQAP